MQRLILFAHGAGAPSSSPWMQGWAERLGELGRVVRFDYPYMAAGRKAPDPLPKLVAAHRAALDEARRGHEGPVVLVGKSMGSRVGCHVALEQPVQAVVCLGYPLVGMGAKKAVRSEVLEALGTPILFVQGTRDALCPLDTLREVCDRMVTPWSVHVVERGDHSLTVGRDPNAQRAANDASIDAIARFLDRYAPVAATAAPG